MSFDTKQARVIIQTGTLSSSKDSCIDPILFAVLKSKFHPENFRGMEPKMALLLGYLFSTQYTDPYVVAVAVNSSDEVEVQNNDDPQNTFVIGGRIEILGRIKVLLSVTPLSQFEREAFEKLFNTKFWTTNWSEIAYV